MIYLLRPVFAKARGKKEMCFLSFKGFVLVVFKSSGGFEMQQ
jgi:hypothetical protein